MINPTIYLDALTAEDVEAVRQWRNAEDMRGVWRTPYLLTREMQADFYRDVVCNRQSPHRYWAVRESYGGFVGMVGLTDIEWENGRAEISLVVNPAVRGSGIGAAAFWAVLKEAYHNLRLVSVVAECYESNPAIGFWEKMAARKHGHLVRLPYRNWFDGRMHGSIYITWHQWWCDPDDDDDEDEE